MRTSNADLDDVDIDQCDQQPLPIEQHGDSAISPSSSSISSSLGDMTRDTLLQLLAGAATDATATAADDAMTDAGADADGEYSTNASAADPDERDVLSMSTISAVSASSYCYIESDEEQLRSANECEKTPRPAAPVDADLHELGQISPLGDTAAVQPTLTEQMINRPYDYDSFSEFMFSTDDAESSMDEPAPPVAPNSGDSRKRTASSTFTTESKDDLQQMAIQQQPNARPRSVGGRTVIVVGRHQSAMVRMRSQSRVRRSASSSSSNQRGSSQLSKQHQVNGSNVAPVDTSMNTAADNSRELSSIAHNMSNLFTGTFWSDGRRDDSRPTGDGAESPARRFFTEVVVPLSGAFMTSMAFAFAAGFCVDYFLLQHGSMDPAANKVDLGTVYSADIMSVHAGSSDGSTSPRHGHDMEMARAY